MTTYTDTNQAFALEQDKQDVLKEFRTKFHLPTQADGQPFVYLCGNSLGLQPKSTAQALTTELTDWANLGVEGHMHARNPWLPYHEFLTTAMANVVGAKPHEVVVMNTLSVNLHLMMVSFYRPNTKRYKILIESDAFPSDLYAVESQLKFHGYNPKDALVKLFPRKGEHCLRQEDILDTIAEHGESIALIMIGNTNYYTGQRFDMKSITKAGHAQGCMVGFDCAHGAGNVPLNLHESGADFAVWCSYKYINSGPGSLGGCFVHERHAGDKTLPRFAGWWGHNKATRFGMRDDFDPIFGAEAWQLSNPPILSMAAIKASLELFEEAGINRLRNKAIHLTGYLEYLLKQQCADTITILTPTDPEQRGSQLSLLVNTGNGKKVFDNITKAGVIADWREPNVIRVSPVPMYNSYMDVWTFVQILSKNLDTL